MAGSRWPFNDDVDPMVNSLSFLTGHPDRRAHFCLTTIARDPNHPLSIIITRIHTHDNKKKTSERYTPGYMLYRNNIRAIAPMYATTLRPLRDYDLLCFASFFNRVFACSIARSISAPTLGCKSNLETMSGTSSGRKRS